MSLLNDVLKSVFAKTNPTGQEQVPSQGQADVLITAALAMLDQAGGIQGIIEKFQRSGLGDIVASWVGTGQNQPINPDQITAALGNDNIAVVAQQASIPTDQGSNVLAELLPAIIDKLTPQGKVPEQGQLLDLGKTILSSLAASGFFGEKTQA